MIPAVQMQNKCEVLKIKFLELWNGSWTPNVMATWLQKCKTSRFSHSMWKTVKELLSYPSDAMCLVLNHFNTNRWKCFAVCQDCEKHHKCETEYLPDQGWNQHQGSPASTVFVVQVRFSCTYLGIIDFYLCNVAATCIICSKVWKHLQSCSSFYFIEFSASTSFGNESWGEPGYLRSQFTLDFIILVQNIYLVCVAVLWQHTDTCLVRDNSVRYV